MLGVLGGNEDLPIERLALSGDRTTLASVSHENCLKLWDLTHLKDSGSDEEEAEGQRANADDAEAPQEVCAPICCFVDCLGGFACQPHLYKLGEWCSEYLELYCLQQ